jgi:hypothetical protein
MVKQIKKGKEEYFMCEACNLYFRTQKLAQKCEQFCNKYKACSIEITKYRVR